MNNLDVELLTPHHNEDANMMLSMYDVNHADNLSLMC